MPYLPIQVPIRFTVALVMLMLIAQAVQLKEVSFTHGIENIIFYAAKDSKSILLLVPVMKEARVCRTTGIRAAHVTHPKLGMLPASGRNLVCTSHGLSRGNQAARHHDFHKTLSSPTYLLLSSPPPSLRVPPLSNANSFKMLSQISRASVSIEISIRRQAVHPVRARTNSEGALAN